MNDDRFSAAAVNALWQWGSCIVGAVSCDIKKKCKQFQNLATKIWHDKVLM